MCFQLFFTPQHCKKTHTCLLSFTSQNKYNLTPFYCFCLLPALSGFIWSHIATLIHPCSHFTLSANLFILCSYLSISLSLSPRTLQLSQCKHPISSSSHLFLCHLLLNACQYPPLTTPSCRFSSQQLSQLNESISLAWFLCHNGALSQLSVSHHIFYDSLFKTTYKLLFASKCSFAPSVPPSIPLLAFHSPVTLMPCLSGKCGYQLWNVVKVLPPGQEVLPASPPTRWGT